jgi:hypothetical protein
MTNRDQRVIDLDGVEAIEDLEAEIARLQRKSKKPGLGTVRNEAIHLGPDENNVEQGLAKLVLTLVELLRQLLERQALRRMDSGSLSDEEIERLGVTFMKLQDRLNELKVAFDLEDDDLNIDLGPLGQLLDDRESR